MITTLVAENEFIILTVLQAGNLGWSHWAKLKVSGMLCSFLGTLGENLFPCHFQLLEDVCTFLAHCSSSVFQTSK